MSLNLDDDDDDDDYGPDDVLMYELMNMILMTMTTMIVITIRLHLMASMMIMGMKFIRRMIMFMASRTILIEAWQY